MTNPAEAEASSPAARVNPYVGPRAFQYGETIYGRSQEIAELRDVLIARRIVLLYSPSGAGKSSLIEAGLRAEMAQTGFRLFPTIRVGSEPPAALDGRPVRNRYVLSTLLSLEEGRPSSHQLSHAELGTLELGAYLDRLTEDQDPGSEPCFIFDQFEELFTLDPTDVAAKRAFLAELGVALRNKGRWALFAMREDFIAQLDPYLGLVPSRLASRYRLDLLDPAAAMVAAQRPAANQDVAFTDAAASRLMDDLRRVRVQRGAVATDELGPHVEPVQLQVVCRQAWSNLDPAAQSIEVDDVVALGNVDDALADFYVEQVSAVAHRTGVSEREIRTWFDEQLISPDGFRTQALEGPGSAGPAVLRELENAHLIRADRRRGTEWYELSHDRLVAPVRASNARWREEHLNPLQREAQAWDARSRPQGLLITGDVLAEAEDWARAHGDDLLPVDREYLEACRAEQHRLDLERKVARRNRVLAVVATAVGVLALAGLVLANGLRASAARERDRAAQERDRAEEELRLRQQAEAGNLSNAWLAAASQAAEPRLQFLAAQAAFTANPDNGSADLTRELTSAQHYLVHDPVYVASARALDRSGTRVVRGTTDGRVEIVDVDTLQRRLVVKVDDPVEAVTFSAPGDLVAVVAGGSVTFWNWADGTQTGQLTAPELSDGFGVAELSMSGGADGLVAAVVYDTADGFYGRLVLWDGAAQIEAPVDAETHVAKAVLAGSRLAVIVEDPSTSSGALHVWQRTAAGWEEQVVDLDFLPPEVPAIAPFGALAFSPDGGVLAAGTGNGLKVYFLQDPAAQPPSQPADAFEQEGSLTITGAAFPTATTVRAVDNLGQVADWQRSVAGEWQRVRRTALAPSFQVQMSADGGRALLGDRNTFAVFDVATGSQLVGQFAVDSGSHSAGRSVVVRQPGAVDEQASPDTPWTRGPAEGAIDAALSPNGVVLGRLLEPSGDLRVSTSGGADSLRPTCPSLMADDTGSAPPDVGLAIADRDIAVAIARLRDDAQAGGVGSAISSWWCVVPVGDAAADGPAAGIENIALLGETLHAVDVSADGRSVVLGTGLGGGGSVTIYPIEGDSHTEPMTGPVTAVSIASGDTPTNVAGDERGNLLVFELSDPGAGATGPGTVARCRTSVPAPERITAVAGGQGSDGERLVVAATRKAVFAYRVEIAAEPCATLIGGFDLLRDEGEVLDLTVDEGGRVTVLESDLNVFTFDPASLPADVARDVAHRSEERGWALTSDDCQALLDQPQCPA